MLHDYLSEPAVSDDSSEKSVESTGSGAAGAVVIVGLGVQWRAQTTLAAERAIKVAERVFFAVNDPWAARFVRSLNPQAEPLPYPRDGRPRTEIYDEMARRVLRAVENGLRVCVVFYGSATLLTRPAHEILRRAKSRGHRARMLPGVSSLDCLLADLDIEPGDGGLQLFEAGQWLAAGVAPNPRAHLVLFQISMIGNGAAYTSSDAEFVRRGLSELQVTLNRYYPRDHPVVIYEASPHPTKAFRAETVALAHLGAATTTEISTLYVPPMTSSSGGRS